jgi:hypothetical protein
MIPEYDTSFSETELVEFHQALTRPCASGSWCRSVLDLDNKDARPEASLDSNVQSFLKVVKDSDTPEAIAERAAMVLGSLLEVLERTQVPLSMTLENLRQQRKD